MTEQGFLDELPTPRDLAETLPVSVEEKKFVLKSRNTISSILAGRDSRKLLIIGPCSVHDPAAIMEYAYLLKKLSSEVQDLFFIAMRVYVEKPRTALGWKGFLHDPLLDYSCDIYNGLKQSRLLFKELTQIEIPIATEFLDPASPFYLSDFISWGCIGARTSSSQIHRQIASHFSIPIGFKNSIEGNIDVALNGIEAARHPHTFMGISDEGRLKRIRSLGNPDAHLVLRGGEREPNYDSETIENTQQKMKTKRLPEALLVDCSHDNSRKNHLEQITVFNHVLNQMKEGKNEICGLMLESFLLEGTQNLSQNLQYGQSITDPCLDWNSTEELIKKGYEILSSVNACAALS